MELPGTGAASNVYDHGGAAVTARKAFEQWWKRRHPEEMKRENVDWFRRDDIWESGGYEQPCVHGDWECFRAGWRAAKRAASTSTAVLDSNR